MDENALNIQAKGRDGIFYTVGMDLGKVKLKDLQIFLFGTPGLPHLKIMRDIIISHGSDGIILVFDASQPDKDKETITILNSIKNLKKPLPPIVFLANKQDLEEARSPEVMKKQNKLAETVKIFPTSTKSELNIEESLKYIVSKVYNKYSTILQLLTKYEENIYGLGQELKKDKVQMRNLLNDLEFRKFIKIDRLNKRYKVIVGLDHII